MIANSPPGQSGQRAIEHGIPGSVDRAVAVVRIEQKSGGRQGIFGLFHECPGHRSGMPSLAMWSINAGFANRSGWFRSPSHIGNACTGTPVSNSTSKAMPAISSLMSMKSPRPPFNMTARSRSLSGP